MALFRTTANADASLPFVFQSAQSGANSPLVSLRFHNKDTETDVVHDMASIDIHDSGEASGHNTRDGFGSVTISTASNGEVSEVARFTDDNRVGINTAAPEAKLHVSGGAIFTGGQLLVDGVEETVSFGPDFVTDTETFKLIRAWSYNGPAAIKPVSRLNVLAQASADASDDTTSSNFGYELRWYDATNHMTLGSETFSNQSWSNCVLEIAEGHMLADAPVVMELHAKKKDVGQSVSLASVSVVHSS